MFHPLSDPAFYIQTLSKVPSYLARKAGNTLLSHWFCQSWTIIIVFLLDCPNSILNVCRQHKMQQLELSWKVWKLTTSRQFSENCISFMFKNSSIINYFLSVYGNAPVYLSELLHLYTPLLTLSDQHLDLSLRFPGQEIINQSGTASGPSGMLLPPSRMPCLKASGKVILFSLSSLLWKLTFLSLTEICSAVMLILAVAVMIMLMVREYACVLACAHE